MKIEILTSNIKNENMVREFIDRKVSFALNRIGARIGSVTVRLEDETRDSAAFDGLCRIDVKLQPRGYVHVSSRGESASDCILQAVRKMENAVKHELDRHLISAATRHQKTKRAILETLESARDPGQSLSSNASPLPPASTRRKDR